MGKTLLEQNSRTMRERRRGKWDIFIGVACQVVALAAPMGGLDWRAQLPFAVVGAGMLAHAYLRFTRIGRYRREDHERGKVRKAQDVPT